MKKLILGVGAAICGMLVICTNYIVNSVVASMPNVTLVSYGKLHIVGIVILVVGLVLCIWGLSESDG